MALLTISMTRSTKIALALLAVVWAGCGGTHQDVAPVHGRVTLDGQPLPHAGVEFRAPGKPLSGGFTDQDGNYDLIFKRGVKGAPIGINRVTILEDTQMTHRPQRVPPRYNEKSELQRDVKPADNVLDFDLTTDGK
jgi:hypothetical protein